MDPKILVATLFLPLFPLSMLFSILFEKLKHPVLRISLITAWPQVGLWLIDSNNAPIPAWVVFLALFTSILYGFRALVLRELNHWICFLSISTSGVLWVVADAAHDPTQIHFVALGFSIPLAILVLVGRHLERRFGAAYTDLYNGLGHSMPRLSAILVFTTLAVIATPVFPGFASMIAAFLATTETRLWECLVLCLIWMTWGWAGARLIQGFVVGKGEHDSAEDISSAVTWLYTLVLTGLAVFGLILMNRLS